MEENPDKVAGLMETPVKQGFRHSTISGQLTRRGWGVAVLNFLQNVSLFSSLYPSSPTGRALQRSKALLGGEPCTNSCAREREEAELSSGTTSI